MPSSSESSAEIDFVTALGRMLRDALLRDAFAADPAAVIEGLRLRACDRPVFLQLRPADLEFQARILLRKRFDLLRLALPQTFRNLGEEAWPEFQHYGRLDGSTPGERNQSIEDAFGFCHYLRQIRPASLCPLEANRAHFIRERQIAAIHFVLAQVTGGRRRPGLQMFFRSRPGRWHEWLIYFGL